MAYEPKPDTGVMSVELLNGHGAMKQWDSTYVSHDLPRWTHGPIHAYIRWQKSVRLAEQYDLTRKPVLLTYELWLKREFGDICDHWGSIRDGNGNRILVMCPYRQHDGIAEELAQIIGAKSWSCKPNGPWHPTTFLYSFNPHPYRFNPQ